MQVAVLGPTRVTRAGGDPVALGAPKHRALLAALALHARREASADTLIDLPWGENPPPAAAAALQTYVAHLRRATRRARRHAAVAAKVTDPACAARHWLEAGPRHAREAWLACAAAARRATAMHAWEEAAELLATAIRSQADDPAVSDQERYAVLMARVTACGQGGDFDGLDDAQVAAVAVAAGMGDVTAEARAAIAAVGAAIWLPRPHLTVHPTLPATLRAVLRRLPAGDSELCGQVLLALAVELYFADAPEERRALVEQGLALARRLGDPALLDWSCTVSWLAIWRPATAEERWALAQEALAAAVRGGDRIREVTVRTLVAISAQETGRIAEPTIGVRRPDGSLLISTSIGFPQKAFNVRRERRVAGPRVATSPGAASPARRSRGPPMPRPNGLQ